MNIRRAIFRVDASSAIGTGHVMRCLTLADALRQEGFEAVFICRMLEGNMADYVEQRGFRVYRMPTEESLFFENISWDADFTKKTISGFSVRPDLLIVDHYGIDASWEAAVQFAASRMLVIDDLANRPHIGDMLLDQNIMDNLNNRYEGLVSSNCRMLLGPKYLLLRPSFYEARRHLRTRSGKADRLLVFFGGSDPTNETSKVLEALHPFGHAIKQVDVVIGNSNPYRTEIEQRCRVIPNLKLHVQVENMDELIVQADFALGSGGVAMWERCYLGLPAAVTIVADNQLATVQLAENSGSIWNLGWHGQIIKDQYTDILHKALDSSEDLVKMSSSGLILMDSHADTAQNRVLKALLEDM